MIDQYTLADTIPVDTLTNGHQINNKIWKNNVMNVTLGNLGSPYLSMFYMNRPRTEGYIFFNTLQEYIEQPQDFVYYNTKTPYTNLAYNMGYPKRRSEEFVQVLFTQNVNRRLNIGIHYKFSTSIGRYESQRADHANVRLFGSYDGDYYKSQMSMVYSRSSIKENGGILLDSAIYKNIYSKADDVPVNFMNQSNRHATYQIHYAQQLEIGHVERLDEIDSTYYEVPMATAYHQIYLLRNHHEFKISDLSPLAQSNGVNSSTLSDYFPMTQDSTHTADSVKYSNITNIFQLKLNEEFNTALRFGLRAFIGNDIKTYHWPDKMLMHYDEKENLIRDYTRQHETLVSTFIGGQIFKNRGENVRLNAGIKYYIPAGNYKVNDITINGNLIGMFRVLKQPTEVWAKVIFEARSPEMFEKRYCSNHYEWDDRKSKDGEKANEFDRTELLQYSGGIKMDSLRLSLTAFGGTERKKIYFNAAGIPTQSDTVVQVLGAYLYKHFSIIGFNSINRVTVQKSFQEDIEPLPTFAIFSSNFYEHLLFKVLTFQIGFDWRYNTKYYAPVYIPATMQFCVQDKSQKDDPEVCRKVGGHHYIDPFVNMQLKRARIYVKYEHLNAKWGDKDYFHTVHYPANPGFFKFGVSWNFYD